jgi:hypothetical protein
VTWFVLRLASFFIWTPIVHKKFARGIHWSWLLGDIGPSFMMTSFLLIIVLSLSIPFEHMNRLIIIVVLIGIGLLMLLCNTLISRAPRNLLIGTIMKRKSNED